MIVKALTFVGALLGGTTLSQFPEYAQQYEQRLAGAVDEMTTVVAQFDTSLSKAGMTREQAFAATPASELEKQLVGDGKANIDRLAFLQTALAKVQNAPLTQQFLSVPSVADTGIAKAAWADFKPAIPVTIVGLACAGLGFIGGWALFATLFGLLALVLGAVFRRKTPA